MKFFNKELSWLSFNERVLQEAADAAVPVVERMRFLGIFSSNMDEFFQVRVAAVRRHIFFSQSEEERSRYERLMAQLQSKVNELQQQFDAILPQVVSALKQHHIHLLEPHQLNVDEKQRVKFFFIEKVRRHLVPILVTEKTDLRNVLREDENYLCVEILDDNRKRYAVIGTGNFHEGTAQVYTDFSLFTCDNAITADVDNVFNYLEQPYRQTKFRELMVAPVTMRQRLTDYIEYEIEQAQQGRPAAIFIKVNNLVDDSLFEREQAGKRKTKKSRLLRSQTAIYRYFKRRSHDYERE